MVRKEAVVLINSLYENQKVPSNQIESLCSALEEAAVNDLYWEVKVMALNFWHAVIWRQLQHQGVIDGTFPSVTFSKEKKKIVTLTQKEIILRLTKVLDELSAFGCLDVLLTCLEDEDDLLVVKASVHVIKCFSEFLNKYNYWQETQESHKNSAAELASLKSKSNSAQTEIVNNDSMIPSPEDTIEFAKSDEVIESILSAQDVNLLAIAYENQMNVTSPEKNNKIDRIKTQSNVSPHAFLQRIETTDLDELIKVRAQWLAQTESFSSLLNDMSCCLQVNEANEADCY